MYETTDNTTDGSSFNGELAGIRARAASCNASQAKCFHNRHKILH